MSAGMLHEAASQPTRKKWPGILARTCATCLFLWIVSGRVDWAGVQESLARSSETYYFLSLLVALLLEWVVAYRLKILMRSTEIEADILELWKLGFVAKFYGLLLPAGIGPAAAKWYKVTQNRGGRLAFAGVTVFEQSLNILQTSLFVAIPIIFSQDVRVNSLRPALLMASAIALLILAVFYSGVVSRSADTITGRLTRSEQIDAGRRRILIAAWMNEMDCVSRRKANLLLVLAASLLMQLILVFRLILLFLAADLILPWSTIVWTGSLVIFLQSLPITLSGIGLRESAFAYTADLFGREAELGVAVGLLLFSQIVLFAIVGGLMEWVGSRSETQ